MLSFWVLNLLRPGRYSLVVEYSSSAFPWLAAGQTLNDVRESANKLKYAAFIPPGTNFAGHVSKRQRFRTQTKVTGAFATSSVCDRNAFAC
jgi:hypothetical protein